jgi:CRISPR-associated endonuclease/helicase Cas3
LREDELRFLGDPDVVRQLGVLWGKSAAKAGGRMNLLVCHLLDTAAVAEQIWDQYLSLSTKAMVDRVAGGSGRGRAFFAWLCGVHDCGKATPAFQRMDEPGAQAVQQAGLAWVAKPQQRWRHDQAGGKLIRHVLGEAGWAQEQIAWIWPLVAGHHGKFPPLSRLNEPVTARGHLHGKGPAWRRVQSAIVEVVTRQLGYEGLDRVQPAYVPSRADQLHLSGLVVMADWIASDERFFQGLDELSQVSLDVSRDRAARAWQKLALRGGWRRLPAPGPETFQDRFGHAARRSQVMVMDAVRRMGGPGLVIVEAPMGEGKTKTALVGAEIMAARFGADGVFVGMPTQATCDPIFTQVRAWAGQLSPGLESQVALLHGKRRFNNEWQRLLEEAGDDPDGMYGTVEEDAQFGMYGTAGEGPERLAPAEWFLGGKRGLLTPLVVGTIDQLLLAATRTKHVMLRMAGLAGKVVILDEVHAADIYMSQFLLEGLRWLGQARVPVILLSATLPPAQRRALTEAYVAGASWRENAPTFDLLEPAGYPNVTAVWLEDGRPQTLVDACPSWRPKDLQVRVEVRAEAAKRSSEPTGGTHAEVVELLADRLRDGGCALVIRNTVDRAQDTYKALRGHFGEDDVLLLHGRLHAAHRADRTEIALSRLGPSKSPRPRTILVATQLAEQSFDVDADILITDLAPIDLLLQRIGRLHRHDGVPRPDPVREPCVVVTGFIAEAGRAPWILPASEGIYGRYPLLRTAALVSDGHWAIPGQVPSLVSSAYGELGPAPEIWEKAASQSWEEEQRARAKSAERFLLTRFAEHENPTLEGLHYADTRGADEVVSAIVRDGEPSVEVVMVYEDSSGFTTWKGGRLRVNGEVPHDLVDEVLGGAVRLPAKFTEAAESQLGPLAGWQGSPWLRHTRALRLRADDWTPLDKFMIRYDDGLGLVIELSR